MVSSYLYYACRDSPVFPIKSHSQVPGVGLQPIFWRTRVNPMTKGSFMTILYFTLRHNLTVTSCPWTTSPLPFCWRFFLSSPANSSKQHAAGIYLSCNFVLSPTSFWLGWGKSPGKYLMSTRIYVTSLKAEGERGERVKFLCLEGSWVMSIFLEIFVHFPLPFPPSFMSSAFFSQIHNCNIILRL